MEDQEKDYEEIDEVSEKTFSDDDIGEDIPEMRN